MLKVGYIRVTHPCAGRVSSEEDLTPRLACVKPPASVHPEPGSNSPLYLNFESFPDLSAIEFLLSG